MNCPFLLRMNHQNVLLAWYFRFPHSHILNLDFELTFFVFYLFIYYFSISSLQVLFSYMLCCILPASISRLVWFKHDKRWWVALIRSKSQSFGNLLIHSEFVTLVWVFCLFNDITWLIMTDHYSRIKNCSELSEIWFEIFRNVVIELNEFIVASSIPCIFFYYMTI